MTQITSRVINEFISYVNNTPNNTKKIHLDLKLNNSIFAIVLTSQTTLPTTLIKIIESYLIESFKLEINQEKSQFSVFFKCVCTSADFELYYYFEFPPHLTKNISHKMLSCLSDIGNDVLKRTLSVSVHVEDNMSQHALLEDVLDHPYKYIKGYTNMNRNYCAYYYFNHKINSNLFFNSYCDTEYKQFNHTNMYDQYINVDNCTNEGCRYSKEFKQYHQVFINHRRDGTNLVNIVTYDIIDHKKLTNIIIINKFLYEIINKHCAYIKKMCSDS